MKTNAPFTPDQIESLRGFQDCRHFHPFTCCDHRTMTVEADGFHCPACGRVQTWCHDFMADGSWRAVSLPIAGRLAAGRGEDVRAGNG